MEKSKSMFNEKRKSMMQLPGGPLAASVRQPRDSMRTDLTQNSMLSQAMENTSHFDFVLQKPEHNSRYYLQCCIYFFDTPRSLTIEVGQNELARDVIKHVMTLYRHSALEEEHPLEHPHASDRYQLFFIDDDESEHCPDVDMGPRNPDEPIGEFASLAFMLNKNFKSARDGGSADVEQIQNEEERAELEAKDQRLLFVSCNTVILKKVTHTVVMDNKKQVGEVINMLAKKLKGKIQSNPGKYIIMMS